MQAGNLVAVLVTADISIACKFTNRFSLESNCSICAAGMVVDFDASSIMLIA